MANEKTQSKVIVEAGLAPHMHALQHLFANQSKLVTSHSGDKRPAGTSRSGKLVDAMKLTPRGLEVRLDGKDLVIGQGSWTYLVESEP